MTGGKKMEYPRGHAKITGFFRRRKIRSDIFLKSLNQSQNMRYQTSLTFNNLIITCCNTFY